MNIAGLQKFTMVDFPGTLAATVFTRGCSFRCPFCHNPELVLPDQFLPIMDEEEIWKFFIKRKGQLNGVCITGGEPTLEPDLINFINKLKTLGYKVKLDSNGWNPEILKKIISQKLVDYFAMDIKASPKKYDQATGSNINMKKIEESIRLIMDSGVDYEFRTTVVKPIHQVEDFDAIGDLIKGANKYFIQNFVESKHVDKKAKFAPFLYSDLEKAKKVMEKYVRSVEIR